PNRDSHIHLLQLTIPLREDTAVPAWAWRFPRNWLNSWADESVSAARRGEVPPFGSLHAWTSNLLVSKPGLQRPSTCRQPVSSWSIITRPAVKFSTTSCPSGEFPTQPSRTPRNPFVSCASSPR